MLCLIAGLWTYACKYRQISVGQGVWGLAGRWQGLWLHDGLPPSPVVTSGSCLGCEPARAGVSFE